MASKRHHDQTESEHAVEKTAKKAKKGFSVGPGNLPDGTHRRKGISFFPIETQIIY